MKPSKGETYISYKLRYIVYSCLVLAITMTLFASLRAGVAHTDSSLHPFALSRNGQTIRASNRSITNQKNTTPIANSLATREQLFIIDNSQFMSKPDLAVAKQLLVKVLLQLTPADRFNIFTVNSDASPLFANSQRANMLSIADAIAFVDELVINGKGNLLSALQFTMSSSKPKDIKSSQIILLSNGQLGYQQLQEFAQKHIGNKQLFSLAIGNQSHVAFMSNVALAGNSATHIIPRDRGLTKSINEALLVTKSSNPPRAQINVTKEINVITSKPAY